jgi:hypothetical protein
MSRLALARVLLAMSNFVRYSLLLILLTLVFAFGHVMGGREASGEGDVSVRSIQAIMTSRTEKFQRDYEELLARYTSTHAQLVELRFQHTELMIQSAEKIKELEQRCK